MSERCVDHLISLMPIVRREADNEWVKGFAGSVMRQSRRPDWRPSGKQLGIMRRLADELFREEAECDVIDEDDEWP